MTVRKGPGRPAFEAGKARTGSFTVKVSDEERAKIEAAAKISGKRVTEWARDALMAAANASGIVGQ